MINIFLVFPSKCFINTFKMLWYHEEILSLAVVDKLTKSVRKRILVPALCLCCLAPRAIAEEPRMDPRFPGVEALAIIQNVLHITQNYYARYRSRETESPLAFADIFYPKCGSPLAEADILKIAAEADRLSREWGLEIDGGATYRTQTWEDADEDDAEANHDYYVGLSWRLLREGLYSNRARMRNKEMEKTIREHLLYKNEIDENHYCAYRGLIAIFDTRKLSLLTEFRSFLKAAENAARSLYYLGDIYIDELIEIGKSIRKIDNRIDKYEKYVRAFEPSGKNLAGKVPFPLYDIDIQGLVGGMSAGQIHDEIKSLENKIIEDRHSTLHDIRFDLFAREHYRVRDGRGREAFSCGFRVGVPIPFKNYRRLESVEKNMAELRRKTKTDTAISEVMNYYYEFKYKLDDMIALLYQREKFGERLRRQYGKAGRLSASDPLHSAKLMKNLYEIELEILEVKEKLYLTILRMIRVAGLPGFRDYVSVLDWENETIRKVRAGEREIYIWTKAFNKISNADLLDLMYVKTIDTALISFSHKTNRDKLRQFVQTANKNGIKTQLMASSTEWIFPANREKINAKLAEISQYNGIHGLHLDIEPHIDKNWDQNRDAHMKLYIDMLKYVKTRYKKPVGVAIPVFYKKEWLAQIFGLADRVNVMAYGIRRVEKMREKIREEREAGAGKIAIALRCGDFESELEFETFARKLHEKLGIASFAIYDLTQYEKLVERK